MVEKDWIFLARKGHTCHGEQFVEEALHKGAVILWEQETRKDCYHCEDMLEAQTTLLRAYYGDPYRHLCVIGVTGTNGKTSVAQLLTQLLTAWGERVMVIGTGHIQYEQSIVEIDNTTPSACTLAYYASLACEHHLTTLIMEVSSHAIDQQRIGLLRFDYILYTNIHSDHLDYHITRTHYQYTKFKLRKYLKQSGKIIVNHDDVSLHPLYDFNDRKIITVGQGQAHLQLSDVQLSMDGSAFTLEQEHYHMPLLGMHNVYNVAQCLVVLQDRAIPYRYKQAIVAKLHGVAGRMELHKQSNRWIIIDYAHTSSSLQNLLEVIHQLAKGRRMIVIVGCGGERDQSKRPQMAQIALNYGDIVIFTSDNPRGEKQQHIFLDMIQGLHGNYEIFENRACAIKYAVKISREHDIIVIAGKGDEHFQLIHGQKIPCNDWECAKKMIGGFNYDT